METVHNAAAAAQSAATSAYTTASKLVFGESKATESGKEPVSGEQGQGSTSSPFDQGNKDDGAAAGQSTAPGLADDVAQKKESGQEPLSGVQGQGTVGEPFDQGNENDGAAAGQSTSNASSAPLSSGAVGGGVPQTTSPQAGIESSAPIQNETGVDKVIDEPTGEQQDAVKAAKEDADDAMIEGPVVDNTAEGGNDLSGEAIKAKATGDQYPKTTGLAAGGVDPTVSQPVATSSGTDAEASRPTEDKSFEKEDSKHSKTGSNAGVAASTEDAKTRTKPKLSERIKDKLHIHKH